MSYHEIYLKIHDNMNKILTFFQCSLGIHIIKLNRTYHVLPSEENDEGNTGKTRKSKLGISRYISNFQSVFESLYVRREKFEMFSFSEQLNIIKKKINS